MNYELQNGRMGIATYMLYNTCIYYSNIYCPNTYEIRCQNQGLDVINEMSNLIWSWKNSKLQRWQRSLSNDINPGGLETSECLEEWSYSDWDPPTINRASQEKYSKIPPFRICFRFCCIRHLLPTPIPPVAPSACISFKLNNFPMGTSVTIGIKLSCSSQGFQASEVETKRSISQCLMLPAAKW